MEEIKNEDTVLLDQEDLNKVSGGADELEQGLRTLAEIESSSIFNKLKKRLRNCKDAGYSKTAELTLLDIIGYARSLGYAVTSTAGHSFIRKYWDLV